MMNECLSFKHYTIVLITHDANANHCYLWLVSFFQCVKSQFPEFPLVYQYDFYDYQDFCGFLDDLGVFFKFYENSNILIQSE